jgi:glycosyltransferase involved in cell wall biosynthesis
LERTLLSLINQNYPKLQIIVFDGGSKDETVEILKKYNSHIDHWTSAPDEGQVDALNKGFLLADGELYGWLCADDELIIGALKKLAREFIEHPEADVVTGGCIRDFNGEFQVTTEPDDLFYEKLSHMNTIEQPSTLWRKAAHIVVGSLDGNYKYAFDWEYWARLKDRGCMFRKINDPLSIYYFSDDNLTSTGGTKIADEMYRVVKTYGPYNGKIADVYRFLYRTFDLRGYYDKDAAETHQEWKIKVFHLVLKYLYFKYDHQTINSYNWNFASRQERGLKW